MNRYHQLFVVASLLCGVVAPRAASAQNLVGQKVMTKDWDVDLRVEYTVVHTAPLAQVLTVDKQQGDWLWIKSHRGWIDRSAVVPYDRAIEHFDRILQEFPTAINHYHRGLAWQAKGELDKAIADYDEAIRMAPDAAAYFVIRGNAWNDKGAYDKAIADYDEAIRIEPSGAAYHGRGDASYEKGDYDEAIANYSEAIRIDPDFAIALNNRGIALMKQGRLDAAIADYSEAIRLDPQFTGAFNNRARARSLMGNFDGASTDFNQAIEISPNDHWPYNDRAWLWATSPDLQVDAGQQAVESATRACELTEWDNSDVITTLSAAYAQAGDFESATSWIQKAMSIDDRDREKRGKMLAYFQQEKPYRE